MSPPATPTPRRRRVVASLRAPWTAAWLVVWLAVAAAGALVMPSGAAAQGGLDDVFGDLGTAEVADETEEIPADLAPNEGSVGGQVIDAETGFGVAGATVILIWPEPADGSDPPQAVQVTDAAGEYRFPRVPEGLYQLSFIKAGYRASAMQGFRVTPGQLNVADFPLPPKAVDTSGQVLDLEAFVVEASMVGDMMNDIELRMDADALVDVMGTEDLAKFAASDVADALKRVSGVSVVEGRFAVIRGLEDRYSSTTFNKAVVPSADPLRQSVQLDLFPSDIVSGIVVAKTFEAPSPGNSGAGSIDIGTMGYPDELTVKLGFGSGFNENALDSFLGYRQNSPIAKYKDGWDVVESDINLSIGGRRDFFDRDFRYKAVVAREIDYDSAIGTDEDREPRVARLRGSQVQGTGSLAFGELPVSGGLFEWQESQRSEQLTVFGGLGMDVDRDGDHRIDLTIFYTEKDIQNVDRRAGGYIPGFDYANTPDSAFEQTTLYGNQLWNTVATTDSLINDFRNQIERPDLGPLSFVPIFRGQSIVQDRQLSVYQLNGEHDLGDLADGLEASWAANYANTRQDETAFRMRYWYEPYDIDDNDLPIRPFPPRVEDFLDLGPGSYRTASEDFFYLENSIDEDQFFARGDLSYEFDATDWLTTKLGTGIWYENAQRTLEFVEYLTSNPIAGRPGVVNGAFVEGPGEGQLGPNVYYGYGLNDLGVPGTSDFERQIIAGYFDAKFTFFDDVDVIAGVRLEQIDISSINRPFTGQCIPPRGSPGVPDDPTRTGLGCPPGYLPNTYPQRYLYLDRFDNPNNPYTPEDPSFVRLGVPNDVILGIELPRQPNGFVDVLTPAELLDLLSGEIDEFKPLPMASIAYRPVEGVTIRGAYSETVSRPSFRELAYYASIVPGIPDRLVGNPFLQLSDVQSVDGRVEWFWGDVGDLLAVSVFYKTIENPIELIVLRDFSVGDPLFSGPFRVYRNNQNDATLIGTEFETQVNLGLVGGIGDRGWLGHWESWSGPLEYFSIGGNFTYIDATVDRSIFEIGLANPYYAATRADIDAGQVQAFNLPTQRRLYNQPEWTANANITFDQPDWGSKVTLSVFAISDVLNAAGSANLSTGGRPLGYVLDEYVESFYQLDLVLSQSFEIPRTPGLFTFRTSIKNLTDSERGIIYDPSVTNVVYSKRSFTVGRDYSFSLQYQWSF
jgi:TonB-dependent receptor